MSVNIVQPDLNDELVNNLHTLLNDATDRVMASFHNEVALVVDAAIQTDLPNPIVGAIFTLIVTITTDMVLNFCAQSFFHGDHLTFTRDLFASVERKVSETLKSKMN